MKLPDIANGTRVTAALLNRIARQANVGANMRAGQGLSWRNLAGGPQLSVAAQELLSTEPAQRVLVVNTGTDAIDAFCPAGIVKSLGATDGEMQAQRVLCVRYPQARDAGDIVIACNRIEANGAGWAWFGGTCLVRLYRWFQSELLDRCDVYAGQRYALASIDGPLDVLWSQKSDSGDLIVGAEHFAVVRFNGRRGLRWFNSGSTSVPFGSPIVANVNATDGLQGGLLSARAPLAADTKSSCFINVGGTVASGEFGKCTAGMALARAKASYNANVTVGAEADQTAISTSGIGMTVVARLGASPDDGKQYAIVNPAAGSSALYTLQIIGGNVLSDGTTQGIKWAASAPTSVPSLYDPNVDTAFIDGIGLARLYDGSSFTNVLVSNWIGNGGPFTQALVFGMQPVTLGTTVSLPLAGDATKTVTLYVPIAP